MFGNSLKQKLKNGEVAFGAFFKINSPSMAEMIGFAGFDFIIVDREHSSFTHLDVENIIRSADGAGLTSIIRVPSASEEHLLHALDSGAGGVQIPGLSSVADVNEALTYTKYYPEGKRGLSFAQRAAKYGFEEINTYVKSSNTDTLTVVHIENKTMADQVEELCQIPQVDILFIGPADLSQSLGKPGAMNDPEVVAIIENVFATAARYNKCVGIYVGGQAALEKYVKLGAKYIAWQSDVAIFTGALKDSAKLFEPYRKEV
jgi:4-hydroxy-2-oxoheptanedioate aldolase